ncbi:MAG: rRNA maturation RNase YbeY [Solirubrobacterales bacterium]
MPVDLSDVPADLRGPVAATLAAVGVDDGHLAVEIVDAARIQALNRDHRGKDAPTDVLSFPIDELDPAPGPRELGDVAICPELCVDMTLNETAIHGVLHLCGYDHETDDGEMIALQDEILASLDPERSAR